MTFEGFDAAPLIETTGFTPAMGAPTAADGATLETALREAVRAERASARAEATILDLWIDRAGGSNLRALERPALGAGTSWHAWTLMAEDGAVLELSGAETKNTALRAAFGDDKSDEEDGAVVKGTRAKDVDDEGGSWGYDDGSYDSGDQGGLGVAGTAEAALVTTGAEGSDADIWVKEGADISNLSAEMKATFAKIVEAFKALGLPHPVITSGRDGDHSTNSLHYVGQALDLRGNNITDAQGNALDEYLSNALGQDYDVIFETFADPTRDHLHIEFDPD